ncbi:hypothetical protein ST47_g5646 [Ascochyta rabiei]|uniref:Uncharacterized protein n=1 Tax=Didymella rabiei TaxID=5454 RepID=A0A163DAD4_DIDRA|nr:hypothetical protein ST47_g5646 [Ascochyta rabiei]
MQDAASRFSDALTFACMRHLFGTGTVVPLRGTPQGGFAKVVKMGSSQHLIKTFIIKDRRNVDNMRSYDIQVDIPAQCHNISQGAVLPEAFLILTRVKIPQLHRTHISAPIVHHLHAFASDLTLTLGGELHPLQR